MTEREAEVAPEPGRDRRVGRAWRELAARVERGDSYVLVFLLLLVAYFVVSLVPGGTFSRAVEALVLGATLLIALRTSKVRPRWQRIARLCVALAFALTLVGSLVSGALALVHVVALGLLVVTPFVILNRIARHSKVNVETLAGAIDVYVLFGLIFAALYQSVAEISGTSFFVQTQHPTINEYLYFSFVSLTTVGYGDFTAATKLGRSIVVLEPLLGQLFLVTAVARLVSIWQPRRRTDNPS